MTKILIFLIIGYLIYKWAKPVKEKKKDSEATVSNKNVSAIDDVMIKDPFCGIYFPKSKGIHSIIDGKDYLFCSNECKDKYISAKQEENG